MAAPPCEATQGAERLTKSEERNREGGGPDDRGGQTWPRTGPADAFTHGGRKRGDRARQLRLSTEWSRGKRACRHAADISAGHRCGGPGRCKVWKLTDLDTTDGLRDFLGLPCNEGAGEGSASTPPPANSERSDKGRKEPAGPPEKGARREPDRSDSEDDPEESPPPRDFGDKIGLPDYGPICCGCGMGSCRGIQHRQALDYSTMITRRAGGAGSPRIAICLAPARNGAIRPTGTDRRLCGHTPCERCVVWVRGVAVVPLLRKPSYGLWVAAARSWAAPAAGCKEQASRPGGRGGEATTSERTGQGSTGGPDQPRRGAGEGPEPDAGGENGLTPQTGLTGWKDRGRGIGPTRGGGTAKNRGSDPRGTQTGLSG